MPLPVSLNDRLGLPVVGAPLFIVSGPELVIAQCKAGVVGSFPALNARPVEKLGEWLSRIEDELGEYAARHRERKVAPYAVNQICHASNDRLMKDMETCVKHRVPIIITSLRPPLEIVEAAHSYGGVVFHDVINVKHARKAAELGVDGLILVCAGAGGHAGTLSPFALVREVKQWFKGTILLSGAISDGWGIASALALGADLAYMGTRASSPPKKPTPIRLTRARSPRMPRMTLSIRTCSPGYTATISVRRSWRRGSIRITCRSRISRR
jgi:nitronate monooxygenase